MCRAVCPSFCPISLSQGNSVFLFCSLSLARERVGVRVVSRARAPPHPRPRRLEGARAGEQKGKLHDSAFLRIRRTSGSMFTSSSIEVRGGILYLSASHPITRKMYMRVVSSVLNVGTKREISIASFLRSYFYASRILCTIRVMAVVFSLSPEDLIF